VYGLWRGLPQQVLVRILQRFHETVAPPVFEHVVKISWIVAGRISCFLCEHRLKRGTFCESIAASRAGSYVGLFPLILRGTLRCAITFDGNIFVKEFAIVRQESPCGN